MHIAYGQVKVSSFYKIANNYESLLLNGDVDVCAYYAGHVQSNLMMPKFETKQDNLSRGCPFTKSLYIEDLKFDFSNYPEILPNGDWRVDMHYYTKVKGTIEWVVKTQLFLQIKRYRSSSKKH